MTSLICKIVPRRILPFSEIDFQNQMALVRTTFKIPFGIADLLNNNGFI